MIDSYRHARTTFNQSAHVRFWLRVKIMTSESNPILDFANDYEFPEYTDQEGINKVVAAHKTINILITFLFIIFIFKLTFHCIVV